MNSRLTANPAYSCAPEPMAPGGKPELAGGKPGQVGGRQGPGDDRLAGDKPEPEGDKPGGDKPGGDKPAVGACRVRSGPLPRLESTTKLKPRARYCSHA